MPLNRDVDAVLHQISASGLPSMSDMSVLQAREKAVAFASMQGNSENVGRVLDILVTGAAGLLSARIYHPRPGRVLPLVVYFHGGGWIIGSVDIADKAARSLANASQCVVASVEYRLSPDTKFPGPLEDCYAATLWLSEHADDIEADRRRLAVVGDSAGGNLAAAVALMARDRGTPHIAFQVLIYPVVASPRDSPFASYRENGEGYLISRRDMEWLWSCYVTSSEDDKNPYAAPLCAANFRGLPPAMILTAEFDPLRDEGMAYAERLRGGGVRVIERNYLGLIHGFFWMSGVVVEARAIMNQLGKDLSSELGDCLPN
jgi:acetyl esterase